jgi:hypothetical protein
MTTTEPITPEERAILQKINGRLGRLGYEERLTHYLAEVDRATPGLPADEREARAKQLFSAAMAEAGRKSGEVRWINGASRRKSGAPRRTKTV